MSDPMRVEVVECGFCLGVAESRCLEAHVAQVGPGEALAAPGSLTEAKLRLAEAADCPGVAFYAADGYEGNLRRLTVALAAVRAHPDYKAAP